MPQPIVLGLIVAALTLAPLTARAHALHSAAVEMEINRETGQVEVALRLFLDDLETALTARAGRPVRAEQVPATEFSTLALAYLRDTLVLIDAQGVALRPEWIGREVKDAANEIWLFIQFAAPASLDGARLRVALLRDQFPDQLNSVLLREREHRLTLLFPPGEAERRISWPH